jgi:hypothetical protein
VSALESQLKENQSLQEDLARKLEEHQKQKEASDGNNRRALLLAFSKWCLIRTCLVLADARATIARLEALLEAAQSKIAAAEAAAGKSSALLDRH